MSKNNQAVYPSMTATAGQSSNDGWITMFKQLGLLPVYAQPLYQPNSLEEGLAALKNQGTYNGPLMEVVSRVPIGSLPQWTPELAEQARQKVAWVYADAQSKGIQIPQIKPPDYDPQLPMGAHPIDIENYIRWEQMVDMQHKFPTSYNAQILPYPSNGEVPMEHRKSLVNRVTDLGQKMKERIKMDMNQNAQNFNQAAGFVQPNQVQQPVQQQAATQPTAPQQMAQQVAQQMGINPQQPGFGDKAKVWMYEHPKMTLALAAGAGAGTFALARWGYSKVFGGDPEFSEDDAAALGEIQDTLLG
jgi:hypothetical protein